MFHSHVCTTYNLYVCTLYIYTKSYVVSAICKYATWWNGAIAYSVLCCRGVFFCSTKYKTVHILRVNSVHVWAKAQNIVSVLYISQKPKYTQFTGWMSCISAEQQQQNDALYNIIVKGKPMGKTRKCMRENHKTHKIYRRTELETSQKDFAQKYYSIYT